MVDPTHFLDNPVTEIYCDDCLSVLPRISQQFDLIFADPPFNYEVKYDGFSDKFSTDDYAKFTEDWMRLCYGLLTDIGSFWINIPDEHASLVDTTATKRFGLTRINWCIWHYRFGQCNSSRFIRSKTHVFYFAKNAHNRIWNPDTIMEDSDRASKYSDPRTLESETPGKRVPLDVWYGEFLGRVQGNNAERCKDSPNQLPEKYLERVIKSCTKSNSWVLDPFLGSGTTCTVARALGLNSIGIEQSQKYAKNAFDRIKKGPVRINK